MIVIVIVIVIVLGTYLTDVRNNVAYHVRGHTYFIEDGGEQFNTFENNLAAVTLCSEVCTIDCYL